MNRFGNVQVSSGVDIEVKCYKGDEKVLSKVDYRELRAVIAHELEGRYHDEGRFWSSGVVQVVGGLTLGIWILWGMTH